MSILWIIFRVFFLFQIIRSADLLKVTVGTLEGGELLKIEGLDRTKRYGEQIRVLNSKFSRDAYTFKIKYIGSGGLKWREFKWIGWAGYGGPKTLLVFRKVKNSNVPQREWSIESFEQKIRLGRVKFKAAGFWSFSKLIPAKLINTGGGDSAKVEMEDFDDYYYQTMDDENEPYVMSKMLRLLQPERDKS